jgi:LysR family transcriptional regulator, glycine cleavage system transcriptional activator
MYSTLPLNAFRVFEAVSRLKSFQAAAEELRVTPSAVSHQMRLLEDWSGRKLVERTAQGIVVLHQGDLLAQTLTSAFSDIAMVSRRVRLDAREKQLVIAVLPSVATCWLIPKLADFRKSHPAVATRVIYAIHGQPIDFRDVDVAIVYYATTPPEMTGIQQTRLLDGDAAPVCSGSFMELHGPLETVEQMMRAGVLHDTDLLGWRRWLSLSGAASVVPPPGPMFEDFNLLRAATLAGQGISLCPLALIHDDLESGRLVQLSTLTILRESGYYLLQSVKDDASAAVASTEFAAWAKRNALASHAAVKGAQS